MTRASEPRKATPNAPDAPRRWSAQRDLSETPGPRPCCWTGSSPTKSARLVLSWYPFCLVILDLKGSPSGKPLLLSFLGAEAFLGLGSRAKSLFFLFFFFRGEGGVGLKKRDANAISSEGGGKPRLWGRSVMAMGSQRRATAKKGGFRFGFPVKPDSTQKTEKQPISA